MRRKTSFFITALVFIVLCSGISVSGCTDEVIAEESRETQTTNDALLYEAEILAENMGVSVDEALTQLELQDLISTSGLEATLYENCVVINIANADYEKSNDYVNDGTLVIPEAVYVEFVTGLATLD